MASAETLLSRETSRAGKGLRAVWSGGIGSGLVGTRVLDRSSSTDAGNDLGF